MNFMAFDRDSFIAGISVGRNMRSWPNLNGKPGAGNLFAFLIEISSTTPATRIMIKTGLGATLDYGDGRSKNIRPSESWAIEYLQQYPHVGQYVVTITGDLSDFRMSYAYTGNAMTKRVLTPFPKSMSEIESIDNVFQGCTKLESVPSDLLKNCRSIKTANYAFSNCTSLVIPEGLFLDCDSITSFTGTFASAGSSVPAQMIPADLFSGCDSAESFNNCFHYANIRYVPETLFDGTPNANNFRSAFSCRSDNPTITSSVPKLWNMFPNADGASCFYGQSLIDGYESIPSDWK